VMSDKLLGAEGHDNALVRAPQLDPAQNQLERRVRLVELPHRFLRQRHGVGKLFKGLL